MFKEEIKPGLKFQQEITVIEDYLASKIGSGALDVFSTPSMIAFMESTAQNSMTPFLEDGFSSVGTEVNIKHLKASLLGTVILFQSELLETDGRKFTFKVKASDKNGLIGEGYHTRFVVNSLKFMEKLKG